ncbi:MAG TPA: HAD-IIIA family hydrolase [Coleofasciculaceae cyanobacterium]|jgi:histidinol-phosphate phosphatase family protein
MTKLLLLDKDGTLVSPKAGHKFVEHPADQKLIKGVAKTIAQYAAQGWTMAIVSNQGGCSTVNPDTGETYKTLEEAIAEMKFCMHLIPEVSRAIFCPDRKGVNAWEILQLPQHLGVFDCLKKRIGIQNSGLFRKPQPGMLLYTMQDLEVEAKDCLMVGDLDADEAAAKAAGIPFMYVGQWLKSS